MDNINNFQNSFSIIFKSRKSRWLLAFFKFILFTLDDVNHLSFYFWHTYVIYLSYQPGHKSNTKVIWSPLIHTNHSFSLLYTLSQFAQSISSHSNQQITKQYSPSANYKTILSILHWWKTVKPHVSWRGSISLSLWCSVKDRWRKECKASPFYCSYDNRKIVLICFDLVVQIYCPTRIYWFG